MSRNKGTFDFSNNFEVRAKSPLDAKQLVGTKADLLLSATWESNAGSDNWTYVGMIVSVWNDSTPENNGLYRLIAEDYTDADNWVLVGSDAVELASIDASIEILRAKDASIDVSIGLLNDWNISQDASFANYVKKAGDTMTGPLTISSGGLEVSDDVSIFGKLFVLGGAEIGGNLTIDGSLFVLDITAIDVSGSFIRLNSGLTGPTPAFLQSGIVVERGDADPYIFVYDEDNQTFRIGITYLETSTHYSDASTQAVATREDAPVNLGIAFWNDQLFRFDTCTGFTITAIREYNESQDASILLRLKEASLGSSFKWVGGLLDVSISTIDTSRYTSALADGIVTDGTLGGIPDGTDVSTLKGKTYDELWDMLLFPTAPPTRTVNSLSFSGLSSAYAEPSAAYTPTLTANYTTGLITNGNGSPGPNLTGDAYYYVFKLPGGAIEYQEAYSGNSRQRIYATTSYVGNVGTSLTWSADVSYNAGTGSYYDNKNVESHIFDSQRVTYHISANSGTITSRNKRYYGTDSNSSLTSSQVMALDVSAFATSFVLGPVTLNPSNEYVYFCWPSSFSGTPTFWLNSLQITALSNIGPLSFTNSYGHTENYDIWRTDTVQTGTGQSWEVKSS